MESYGRMKEISYEFFDRIMKADYPAMGQLLDENWNLKRTLSDGITNGDIDSLYQKGINAGAYGGKLIGAGGGGFLLFMADPDSMEAIAKTTGLKKIDFDFDFEGSRIIYVSR